jgi:hypothetical protein
MFQPYTMHKLNNRWFFTTKRTRSCMNCFVAHHSFWKYILHQFFFCIALLNTLCVFFVGCLFNTPFHNTIYLFLKLFRYHYMVYIHMFLSNLLFYWFCNMIYYSFPCLSFYHTKCINWIIVTKYATYNLTNFSIHFFIGIYTIKKPNI